MSTSRMVAVNCDIGLSGCTISTDGTDFETVAQARRAARENEGWKFSKGKDVCPNCAAIMKSDKERVKGT